MAAVPKQLTPWVKGKSGNPSGRPKDYEKFKDLCKTYTPEAVAKLVQAVRMKRVTSTNVRAAEILLAYGWGRPAVALEVNGQLNVNIPAMLDEARARVKTMTIEAEPAE